MNWTFEFLKIWSQRVSIRMRRFLLQSNLDRGYRLEGQVMVQMLVIKVCLLILEFKKDVWMPKDLLVSFIFLFDQCLSQYGHPLVYGFKSYFNLSSAGSEFGFKQLCPCNLSMNFFASSLFNFINSSRAPLKIRLS